jgi:hypothetical protein
MVLTVLLMATGEYKYAVNQQCFVISLLTVKGDRRVFKAHDDAYDLPGV